MIDLKQKKSVKFSDNTQQQLHQQQVNCYDNDDKIINNIKLFSPLSSQQRIIISSPEDNGEQQINIQKQNKLINNNRNEEQKSQPLQNPVIGSGSPRKGPRTVLEIFRNLKLKIVGRKLLSMTISRMQKNLQSLHYALIYDKATPLESASYYQHGNQAQNMLNLKKLDITILQSEEIQQHLNKQTYYKKIYDDIAGSFAVAKLKALMEKVPLISPSSFFKTGWDFFQMLFILIYFFMIPIHIAISVPFTKLINKTIAEAVPYYLILDMIINMNTGYYDKGRAVTNSWNIITNYLKNNMITDMFSVLPFITYQISSENTDFDNQAALDNIVHRMFLLFFFLKINSFTQILRKIEERSNLSKNMTNYIKLLKLLFTIILIAHFFACSWLFLSRLEQESHILSWSDSIQITHQEWISKYINSFYYSVVTMTTVGYGDITPKSEYEKILAAFIIMMSCGVFAYTLNEIGNIFHEFSKNSLTVFQNTQIINSYMQKKNVSQDLQYQVREYLEYFWREAQERDQEAEMKIIESLSDNLKEKLLLEANKIVLIDSPIFRKNFSDKVIQKTVFLILEQKCQPEQFIFNEGDIDDCEIYFIEKGAVDIVQERILPGGLQPEYQTLRTLQQGDCFGIESFFTGMQRGMSVRSSDFCTLLVIRRKDFIQLLQGFQEDYEQFCQIKDNIIFNSNYQQVELCCYSCLSYKHLMGQCPYLHYTPGHRKVIHIYQRKSIQIKRIKKQRTYFPKSKSRTLRILTKTTAGVEKYQIGQKETLDIYSNKYIEQTIEESNQQQANLPDEGDQSPSQKTIIYNSVPQLQQQQQYIQTNPQLQYQWQLFLQQQQQLYQQQQQQSPLQNQQSTFRGQDQRFIRRMSSKHDTLTNQKYLPSQMINSENNVSDQSSEIGVQKTFSNKELASFERRDNKKASFITHQQPLFQQQNNQGTMIRQNNNNRNNNVSTNYQEHQYSTSFLKLQENFLMKMNSQLELQQDNNINGGDYEQLCDSFKNFSVYFPYDNLSYIVELLNVDEKHRKMIITQMKLEDKRQKIRNGRRNTKADKMKGVQFLLNQFYKENNKNGEGISLQELELQKSPMQKLKQLIQKQKIKRKTNKQNLQINHYQDPPPHKHQEEQENQLQPEEEHAQDEQVHANQITFNMTKRLHIDDYFHSQDQQQPQLWSQ